MKKNDKKGFTIVELVIVIAVIAILAAVLIPNISRLVKKAQVSSDLSLVRNLNMALETESATMDYPTAYSAFQAVKENGYDIAKIEAKASDNRILYDEVNKCFAYLNGKDLEYYPNSQKSETRTPDYKLWAVFTEAPESANAYSVYWNGADNADITIHNVGFDAGDKLIKKLTYQGDGEVDVVIRTNGDECELDVNAKNATVRHYGFAKTVTVTAVASNSYHENGYIGTLNLGAGAKNVVIEKSGIVFNLASKNAAAKLTNNGTILAVASGVDGVSASKTYDIADREKLEMFRDAVNSGIDFAGVTVNLKADIVLEGAWKPIGLGSRQSGEDASKQYTGTAFKGTFDGNNHTIRGLSNIGYDSFVSYFAEKHGTDTFCYGFFGVVDGATIKNLKMANVNLNTESVTFKKDNTTTTAKGDSVGAIVGFCVGSLTMENCSVSGSVIGYDAVGGLVGRAYDQNGDGKAETISIKGCTNNATVYGSVKVAGIVGYVGSCGQAKSNKATEIVIISDCVNNGDIKATEDNSYVYGIAGFGFGNDSTNKMDISITNNTNAGKIETEATEGKHIAFVAGNCAWKSGDGDAYTFTGNKNEYNGDSKICIVVLTQSTPGAADYTEANNK